MHTAPTLNLMPKVFGVAKISGVFSSLYGWAWGDASIESHATWEKHA